MTEASETTGSAAELARILLVTDGDERAVAIKSALHGVFGARLRTEGDPARAVAVYESFQPDVLVFGFAALDAAERCLGTVLAVVGAGRPNRAPACKLVVCDRASTAEAARLCRQDVFDDYVQQFPEPADPERLTTSLRLACRLASLERGRGEPGVAASPAPMPTRPQARPVVLVVEDDEFARTLLTATLEREPLELHFEGDGSAVFDRVAELRPAMILMDIHLPGCDGVELTQRLKSTPALASIPVLMMTGEARRETLMRSLNAGAVDFIVKPFVREALLAKLAKYLPAA